MDASHILNQNVNVHCLKVMHGAEVLWRRLL